MLHHPSTGCQQAWGWGGVMQPSATPAGCTTVWEEVTVTCLCSHERKYSNFPTILWLFSASWAVRLPELGSTWVCRGGHCCSAGLWTCPALGDLVSYLVSKKQDCISRFLKIPPGQDSCHGNVFPNYEQLRRSLCNGKLGSSFLIGSLSSIAWSGWVITCGCSSGWHQRGLPSVIPLVLLYWRCFLTK